MVHLIVYIEKYTYMFARNKSHDWNWMSVYCCMISSVPFNNNGIFQVHRSVP
jgi:hypothetical protein